MFIGGSRLSVPLDSTSEKKLRLLADLRPVSFVGFSENWRPRLATQHARLYLLPNLPLAVLRHLEILALGTLLALWVIGTRRARILVAQSPHEGLAAACAKIAAGWFGCRVSLIVESHGDFEQSVFLYRRLRCPALYRAMMRRAARFTLRQADVLRAISASTRAQLQQWTPDLPCVQFPAWTDIDAFLQTGRTGPSPSPTVLYAGMITPLKGVHHLVGAFGQLSREFPAARLVLAGGTADAGYGDRLRHLVQQAGLDDRVRFAGHVDQEGLAALMAQADVFVLPSYSEGLGRVVFEAMAVGLPVIASPVGGIPEILEEGRTGWFADVGDEAQLTARLRWVFEHPAAADDMGRRGRDVAAGFFSTTIYRNGYAQAFSLADQARTSRERRAPSAV